MIAITRAARDPATRAYLDRKIAEGKTRREAIRCLKRHLARRFHRLLTEPAADHPAITAGAPSPMHCLT
jgi:transposase